MRLRSGSAAPVGGSDQLAPKMACTAAKRHPTGHHHPTVRQFSISSGDVMVVEQTVHVTACRQRPFWFDKSSRVTGRRMWAS